MLVLPAMRGWSLAKQTPLAACQSQASFCEIVREGSILQYITSQACATLNSYYNDVTTSLIS